MFLQATGEVLRLYGAGPERIVDSEVVSYFKYDSGAKEFRPLQTQGLTTLTCGIALTV